MRTAACLPALLTSSLLLGAVACTGAPPPQPSVSEPTTAGSGGGSSGTTAAAAAGHPRLVVYVVVDQFPVRLLDDVLPLATGGFSRLTGPDAYVGVARYPYAVTFTCPGHTTLSTGAAPSASGIPSNDWLMDGKPTYCADVSFLRAQPLSDVVEAHGGSVASLSLKDRGAVMLGGRHADLVAWFDADSQQWQGTNVQLVAAAADAKKYVDQPWTALHADAYAQERPDDQPFEGSPAGLGRTFPHPSLSQVGPKYYKLSPFGGSLLTDAAIAAVDGLKLGTDDTPDLLTVSYSETDYVGHAYGAESWEAEDTALRLDADLARLFDHLDQVVGKGRYAVVLSSDHGSDPLPAAGHVRPEDVEKAANDALAAMGVKGKVGFDDPSIWLPDDVRRDPTKRAPAAKAVARAIAKLPGIGAAYAWRDGDLETGNPKFADAVRLSVDDERSGDVYVVLGERWLFGDPSDTGTSHGTPYDYDQRVPFLAWGEGVKPGKGTEDVDTRAVAPTVAALLGVPKPAQATLDAVSSAVAPASPSR